MTEDLSVYGKQGFGSSFELTDRIGLLIVDFVNGFADPQAFGGGNIPEAIDRTHAVLEEARRRAWPIAHSRIVFANDGGDANIFSAKVPSLLTLTETAHASQIVPSLAPLAGELVVRKTTPSAFFGTNLAPWLTQAGVDCLVVAGCVTSGCIRSSVVDAMCFGYRPFVLQDCVGDRALAPHNANLFDMSQKYAQVLSWAELVQRLR